MVRESTLGAITMAIAVNNRTLQEISCLANAWRANALLRNIRKPQPGKELIDLIKPIFDGVENLTEEQLAILYDVFYGSQLEPRPASQDPVISGIRILPKQFFSNIDKGAINYASAVGMTRAIQVFPNQWLVPGIAAENIYLIDNRLPKKDRAVLQTVLGIAALDGFGETLKHCKQCVLVMKGKKYFIHWQDLPANETVPVVDRLVTMQLREDELDQYPNQEVAYIFVK